MHLTENEDGTAGRLRAVSLATLTSRADNLGQLCQRPDGSWSRYDRSHHLRDVPSFNSESQLHRRFGICYGYLGLLFSMTAHGQAISACARLSIASAGEPCLEGIENA